MSITRKSPAGWSVHPGEILREEFLRPLHLSPHRLARELHVSAPTINDVVLERRAVSAETAVLLARYFGTSPQFWLSLQASHDVHRTKRKLAAKLKLIRPLAERAQTATRIEGRPHA
jgi:addiction module HigA family antidote